MITFNEIKNIFGNKEEIPSKLVLALAITNFSANASKIFQIFNVSLDSYMTMDDNILEKAAWINKNYSGKSIFTISQNIVDPKLNLYTTTIFKNLYKIIDETNEWDKYIENSSLLNKFIKKKNEIFKQLKKNYRNKIL